MNDECIHGLDRDRCDSCSPKAAPATAVKAPAVRATRTPRKTGPASLRGPSPTASTKPRPDVGEQRIYHVTHASNLGRILERGGLLAGTEARPVLDISSDDARAARRATLVAGPDTATVDEHVPFYLSPNARLWEVVRAGGTDPRLSPAMHTHAAAEFVILVSTVKAVSNPDASIVVTDGDAAGPLTRFAASSGEWERMLQRIVGDEESEAPLSAEFLVKAFVPLDAITLIGVPHDKARDAVKLVLAASTHRPRVAVHPPWFAVPTED